MQYVIAGLRRKAVGEETPKPGVYTFLATSAALDRQGEVVTVEGWELIHYRANPVVVDSHNYGSIENIIGRTVEIRETAEGLEADIAFNETPRGRLATQLVEGGDLRAVSVGFRAIEMVIPRDSREPVRHTVKELMEISAVAVPANPEALRLRGLDALATKAGRVLSAANERRLREAVGLLGEVLGSLQSSTDDEAAERAADEPTLEIDLSVLKQFVEVR